MQRANTPVGLQTLQSVELVEVDLRCFHGCRLALRQFQLLFSGLIFADNALAETLSASIETHSRQVLCLSSSTRLIVSHSFFHSLRVSSEIVLHHTTTAGGGFGGGRFWDEILNFWTCGLKP